MADSSTKVWSISLFFLSALGQIHFFEKKIDDAQTQNLSLLCMLEHLIDTKPLIMPLSIHYTTKVRHKFYV